MDFYNQDNYSFSDIENLIKNEVEESIHLDYKEARALGKDDPKKAEITKDMMIKFKGNAYNITYINDYSYDRKYTEIIAESVKK